MNEGTKDHFQTGNGLFPLGTERGWGKPGHSDNLHCFGPSLHGPDGVMIIVSKMGQGSDNMLICNMGMSGLAVKKGFG
jgi:hypothetical protein